jgi:hypothetical protein
VVFANCSHNKLALSSITTVPDTVASKTITLHPLKKPTSWLARRAGCCRSANQKKKRCRNLHSLSVAILKDARHASFWLGKISRKERLGTHGILSLTTNIPGFRLPDLPSSTPLYHNFDRRQNRASLSVASQSSSPPSAKARSK